MAVEMTRKQLHYMFKHVLYVSYCDLQSLLNADTKIGYNAGVYGWNWSAYAINKETIINTGYRNMTGRRIPYELVRKYEQLGRMAIEKYSWRESDKLKDIKQKLLNRLIAESFRKDK